VLKSVVFWVVVLYSLVVVYWHFRGSMLLRNVGIQPQDYRVKQPKKNHNLPTTTTNSHCHENLKSYIKILISIAKLLPTLHKCGSVLFRPFWRWYIEPEKTNQSCTCTLIPNTWNTALLDLPKYYRHPDLTGHMKIISESHVAIIWKCHILEAFCKLKSSESWWQKVPNCH
jgi:hypothetical protein